MGITEEREFDESLTVIPTLISAMAGGETDHSAKRREVTCQRKFSW